MCVFSHTTFSNPFTPLLISFRHFLFLYDFSAFNIEPDHASFSPVTAFGASLPFFSSTFISVTFFAAFYLLFSAILPPFPLPLLPCLLQSSPSPERPRSCPSPDNKDLISPASPADTLRVLCRIPSRRSMASTTTRHLHETYFLAE